MQDNSKKATAAENTKSNSNGNQGSFYFYNPTTVAFGQKEFQKNGAKLRCRTIGEIRPPTEA